MSKYSPTEFIPGAKYFQGTRSPNEKERELYGYSQCGCITRAETVTITNTGTITNPKTKQIENVEMPVKYVIEMFCDRVAASKIYNGKNYTDGAPFTYFCRIRVQTPYAP